MRDSKKTKSLIDNIRNNSDRQTIREKRNYLVFGDGGKSVVSVSESPRKLEAFGRSMVYSAKTGKPMPSTHDNMRLLVASKFVELGLDIDKIGTTILDAMDATNAAGREDHNVRLKASQLALTALGIIGAREPAKQEEPDTMRIVEGDISGLAPGQIISTFMGKVRAASSRGSVRPEDVKFSDSDIEELGGISKAAVGEMKEHDIELGVHIRPGSRIDKLSVFVHEAQSNTEKRADDVDLDFQMSENEEYQGYSDATAYELTNEAFGVQP